MEQIFFGILFKSKYVLMRGGEYRMNFINQRQYVDSKNIDEYFINVK